MDYRASMIPPRPQAGRWEQLLEVLNGLSASQAPQMPTMGGAMGALKSYGASLPQSPDDMIGKPNPNLPVPDGGPSYDPKRPWLSTPGQVSGYRQNWQDKTHADRLAHYGQQPETPGPSLAEANPILMGTETVGIGDIPVGNRMTPGRRWNEGLAADPLGATRMSQPIVGGTVPPDANDIRQQADLSKYQGELSALDGLSARAKPIVESLSTPGASTVDGPVVPSRQKQLMAQLDAMPNAPDSTREAMIFAALNTGAEDRASGQGAKPYQSVRKYAPGRQEELAARKQAVQDRAQRKGMAREARMGGGEGVAFDRTMEMYNRLPQQGGAGGDAPPDPALLTAMFGPQVAEQYRLQYQARLDNERGKRAIDIQERQLGLAENEAAEVAKQQAVLNLPTELQNKAGARELATTGQIADESILQAGTAYKNAGLNRDQAKAELVSQHYPSEQVERVLSALYQGPAIQPGLWDVFGAIGEPSSGGIPQQWPGGVAPMSMGQ